MDNSRRNSSASGSSSRRNRDQHRERDNESQRTRIPSSRRGERSSSAGTREDDRERKRIREELGASSASPMITTENTDEIPDSVRGAPEELKALIRKKQNKESARRSRMRKKELFDTLSGSLEAVENRTSVLEERVRQLEVAVRGRGRGRGGDNMRSNRDANRSNHRNAGGSSRTHTGSASNHRQSRDTNDDEMDVDEEVEKLINRCLDQD